MRLLVSAGHTALYLVTMESEERGSGFFGRTTFQQQQHVTMHAISTAP